MKQHASPKLLFGYHGTNAPEATFDPELGAFFASKRETSARYGRNVGRYRIHMENPAHWSKDLVAGFQDFLIEKRQAGFSDEERDLFRRSEIRAGADPEQAGDSMDSYVQAMLTQPAERITFSDTDPLFGLLRKHLMDRGHDGLVRPHEVSDGVRDGSLEYVPFRADQFAPLIAPDAPAAVAQTKLRDRNGELLILYRGEQSGQRFDKFDRSRTQENGFFFTEVREVARNYDRDKEPRAFLIAADRVLDLTRDTQKNRAFVAEWAKSFDDWIDRSSGEQVDPFDVLESGVMFDYEGTWSGERWKDLQATAEAAGFDAVVLPDMDPDLGVFPAVVVFKPESVWELKPPMPGPARDPLIEDRQILRSALRAPDVAPEMAHELAAPEMD